MPRPAAWLVTLVIASPGLLPPAMKTVAQLAHGRRTGRSDHGPPGARRSGSSPRLRRHRRELGQMESLLEENWRLAPGDPPVDANAGVLGPGAGHRRIHHPEHMSIYGYPRPTSPSSEVLREHLTVFDGAAAGALHHRGPAAGADVR